MKSLFQRPMLALACAATLAACGGSDDGNLILGGSVTGLYRTGLVLTNGTDTLEVGSGVSSFAFAKLIPSDSNYEVKIAATPAQVDCSLKNAVGKAGSANVTTVQVICLTKQHKLGGTVTGLAANESVTLINAPEQLVVTSTGTGGTAFTFAQTVGEGNPYGVAVSKTSSTAQTCRIDNGGGTMGSADVSTLAVVCTP
jgi:hypothetical protein